MKIRIQIAKKTSLFKSDQCATRSAFERNFNANANSMKPKKTLTVFSHPPLLGREFNHCGNRAKSAKGSPRATPNPASPAVKGQAPSVAVPTNNVPKIGPVHEKDTMARVTAMKKTPASPDPCFALVELARLLGSVIS